MVNKGSKFWQKNWETHVSLLEKSEIGSLYDVYLNPKESGHRWIPTREFDFSVTKVNMWASFIIVICSFLGLYFVQNGFLTFQNTIFLVLFLR